MFTLRRADENDWARLWHWRNDPVTLANFKDSNPVLLNEHVAWLRDTLIIKTRRLFVLQQSEAIAGDNAWSTLAQAVGAAKVRCVGTARADLVTTVSGVHVDCSITIAPERRGKGYADVLIGLFLAVLDASDWTMHSQRAYVRLSNVSSLRAFAAHGFAPLLETMDVDSITLERAR